MILDLKISYLKYQYIKLTLGEGLISLPKTLSKINKQQNVIVLKGSKQSLYRYKTRQSRPQRYLDLATSVYRINPCNHQLIRNQAIVTALINSINRTWSIFNSLNIYRKHKLLLAVLIFFKLAKKWTVHLMKSSYRRL